MDTNVSMVSGFKIELIDGGVKISMSKGYMVFSKFVKEDWQKHIIEYGDGIKKRYDINGISQIDGEPDDISFVFWNNMNVPLFPDGVTKGKVFKRYYEMVKTSKNK